MGCEDFPEAGAADMTRALVPFAASAASMLAVIAASGESARLRFLEFFASNIRNRPYAADL